MNQHDHSADEALDDPRPTNDQQATYWNEIGGPHWVQQQRQFDRMLTHFGARAIERLDPRPGERVLDVGCGTGTTTLELAAAVGPNGAVLGCDIAPTMIEAARTRAVGTDHLTFEVRDAQADDLAPAGTAFDAVFSRFGVMFFSEPSTAFANIAAAVRPGGRMVFACWQHEDHNAWISDPARIMRSFTPEPVFPPPNMPGPFAFADPERIRTVLTEGGWADIRIEPFTAPTVLGNGEGIDAAATQVMGTTVGQIMRRQVDDETFEAATTAVRSALAEHLVGGAVVYEGSVWIVEASRA